MPGPFFSPDHNEVTLDLTAESLQVFQHTLKARNESRGRLLDLFSQALNHDASPAVPVDNIPDGSLATFRSVEEMVRTHTSLKGSDGDSLKLELLACRAEPGKTPAMLLGSTRVAEDPLIDQTVIPLFLAHQSTMADRPAWCRFTPPLPAETLDDSTPAGLVVTGDSSTQIAVRPIFSPEAFSLSLVHGEQQGRTFQSLLKRKGAASAYQAQPFSYATELMIETALSTLPSPFGISRNLCLSTLEEFKEASLSGFRVTRNGKNCSLTLHGARSIQNPNPLLYPAAEVTLIMDLSLTPQGLPMAEVTDWNVCRHA